MAGSVSCTMLGLPFDVAKSRIQAGEAQYRGLTDCLVRTARHEGILALYKGTMPALSSAMTENAVGITVQRALRRQLAAATGRGADARYEMGTEVMLGGATGVVTALAICPFEVLKVRLQVAGANSQGWFRECWHLVRAHGPAGLYKGMSALLMRDVPFNALFYGGYETICTSMMRMRGLGSKEDLGTPSIFLAGGLAGSLGWSVIMPFDVAKTRLQTGASQGPLLPLMTRIVQQEGVMALFTGWTAAIARAFPANAGLFAGVELMSRLLRDL